MRYKIHFLLALILFFALEINSFSQIPEFKQILLQFTNNIKRNAFNQKFSYYRWKNRMLQARNSNRIGKLLIRLESNLEQGTMKSNWNNKRNRWRMKLYNAISISEIANALYLFEVGMNWSATKSRWQMQRRLWVRKLQTLY